jgi:hypothetical protein
MVEFRDGIWKQLEAGISSGALYARCIARGFVGQSRASSWALAR